MNKKSDYFLFFFYKLKGLGLKTIYSYLKIFASAEKFYLAAFENSKLLDKKTLFIIQEKQRDQTFIKNIKIEWSQINATYCTILDPDYPPLLKNIYDPPLFLFYQGNKKLLTSNFLLTMVGSRTFCSYHQILSQKIISQLQSTPLILVSGLALGIDTQVHKSALENNLATIAVLGSGFSPRVLYPKSNLALTKKIIAQNGLILSEYPPNTEAATYQFPKRNRILAGLSPLTIIISGAKKSGTLITAQLALDAGREVYALPGNINQTLSQGPNQLIAQGAQILLAADDILNFYNLSSSKSQAACLNEIEQKIIKILEIEALPKEIIAQKLQFKLADLQTIISNLELKGLVKINIFNQVEIS